MECYRRAEPHWERRHEVRARSTDTVKRGVGMASQIWYGGGGPPSYAWIRVGSDGRATVVTAMQDIGTGTRTAMAQIAAEELGIPLEHVTVVARRLGPRAVRVDLGRLVDDPVDGAGGARGGGGREAPDHRDRRAALRPRGAGARHPRRQRRLGGRELSTPLAEVVGLLEDAQILGKGARGPNPTGMQVLTFGVQVAEVAVDIETGEVWVDRIAAIHDVGRVINPLGASSQVEGGIIQGIGHTLSEERLHDPTTGRILTTSLDAYKLPTIADVPEIVSELVDEPDAPSDEPRLEGPRRAADRPDRRGDRERDPRRDRAPTCAQLPISREEMLRALREAEVRARAGEAWSSGRRLASPTLDGGTAAARRHRGRAAAARRAPPGRHARRHPRASCPRGIERDAHRRRHDARRARVRPGGSRRRCARRAGSPRARSCATWARSAATCCRRRAAGTGASSGRAACTAATSASRSEGEHREHAIFANDFCASAHPSDVAAALLALDATVVHDHARAPDRRALPPADRGRPPDDDARRPAS